MDLCAECFHVALSSTSGDVASSNLLVLRGMLNIFSIYFHPHSSSIPVPPPLLQFCTVQRDRGRSSFHGDGQWWFFLSRLQLSL